MATGDARVRRRKTRRRRVVVVAAGLAIVTGGTVGTAAAVDGAAPRWQVRSVKMASVTQTVESSGTISASNKATSSFAVSGTVKSVPVKVGQTVTMGEKLATLDTTSLQSGVDSAEATLASAKQRLEADETGQTSINGATGTQSAYEGSAVTGTSAVALTATATVVTVAANTGNTNAVAEVQAAQQAVIAAQKAADAGQKTVDAAQQPVDQHVTENVKLSDAQHEACATSESQSSETSKQSASTNSSTASTSTTSAACTSAQANYETSASRLATDMKALDVAIDAQDGNVAKLDSAIAALDAAIKKLQSTGGGTPSTGSSSQTGNPPTTATSGGATKTAQPASAATLAADQAAIDSASAAVTEAEQNLAAATLTSPISGKVAAVGLNAGASASGASITIVGVGIQKVSTTVPLADVDLVKQGQAVTVAADGVTKRLSGSVTSIGLLSTTTGSTTTFPVVVTLDEVQPNLYDGTGADVVITTGTAKNVVTVPNSALHSGPRGTYTVIVLKNGVTSTRTVTLGVAAADVTEVKSGLSVGDQVVLADLNEELPSSTTATTTGRTGGFFGGAGGAGVGGPPGGGR